MGRGVRCGLEEGGIVFSELGAAQDCVIEVDCSEEGFMRVENPSGFRPMVLIDGQEDERPAFALA